MWTNGTLEISADPVEGLGGEQYAWVSDMGGKHVTHQKQVVWQRDGFVLQVVPMWVRRRPSHVAA